MSGLQILREATALPAGTAACVGAFDGLHLGHRALLDRARAHGEVALVTFDPHPQRVLAPDRAPPLLLLPAQRVRLAEALGVAQLVLLPFDATMAARSAADFVHTQLVHGLRPTAVVVGSDFRFGAGRKGGTDELSALLAPAGIACEVVPPVPMPAAAQQPGDEAAPKLGSSAIRAAIGAGQVERAAIMLARPHALLGEVVQGDRRGRTIGFPTANLHVPEGCVPAPGVYAGWATVWPPDHDDLRAPMAAVVNIGTRPTFAGHELRIEAHLLDRALGERLYGATIELWLTDRLRDEQRFAGVDALLAQIQRDAARARAMLGEAAPATVLPAPETSP